MITFLRQSIFHCGLFFNYLNWNQLKNCDNQHLNYLAKKLSTKLLDHVFNETKHDVKALINGHENLCLISD